jgi:hypothetical protein
MSTKDRSRLLGVKLATVSAVAFLAAICARQVLGHSKADLADFPEGYDAVTAAPNSHRVIFENALVRVLEVTMPPPGKTEPMHHHHWPSFFLDWDTGRKSPHIRYHQPGNVVRDVPSVDSPVSPGSLVCSLDEARTDARDRDCRKPLLGHWSSIGSC